MQCNLQIENKFPKSTSMKHLRLLAIFLSMTACTAHLYNEPTDGDIAYISFTSIGEEIPQLTLTNDCVASQVSATLVENRDPTQIPESTIKIPAEQPITISINYIWFSEEKGFLDTKYFLLSEAAANTTTQPDIKSCKQSATFLPQKDKYYDAALSVSGDDCKIEIKQATRTKESGKQVLSKDVKYVKNSC